MNTFLNSLDWRYAVKKFDTEKKVSKEDLQKILNAIRMSPSSYGLQPYRVIVIDSQDIKGQELKKELKEYSFGQNQIDTCSHLLVFVAKKDLQKRIGEYANIAEFKSRGLFDKVKFEAGARSFFGLKYISEDRKLMYATNNTFLALGFALAACAELHVDSCAMEGFSHDKYAEKLNIEKDEFISVILPIGYRIEDCAYSKTRFEEKDLFKFCN